MVSKELMGTIAMQLQLHDVELIPARCRRKKKYAASAWHWVESLCKIFRRVTIVDFFLHSMSCRCEIGRSIARNMHHRVSDITISLILELRPPKSSAGDNGSLVTRSRSQGNFWTHGAHAKCGPTKGRMIWSWKSTYLK
jgi:hypothetical protein